MNRRKIKEWAMSKYMNPYTDYGFKRLFGEEFNKDILIDFLNEIFPNKLMSYNFYKKKF